MTKKELQKKYDLLIEGLVKMDRYLPTDTATLRKRDKIRYGRNESLDKKEVIKYLDVERLMNNCL